MPEAEHQHIEDEFSEQIDAIIIVPLHLSRIIAVDLRPSAESSPQVGLFNVEEILSDDIFDALLEVVRDRRKESVIKVQQLLEGFATDQNLVELVEIRVGKILNQTRPEIPKAKNSHTAAFLGPIEMYTELPSYEQVKLIIERKAGIEVVRKLGEVIEELQTEENNLVERSRSEILQGLVKGNSTFITLWQNPQSN